MSILTTQRLAKSFGERDIFTDITFAIPQRARCAIVGPNGIGKTTLLRILAGEDEPSSGEVHLARGVRIGYLPQESVYSAPGTLWEECLASFTSLRQMETELRQLEEAMSGEANSAAILARYGPLQAEYERLGGYTYITFIEQVLTGLGFNRQEFYMPLMHLSGGQRTRALLAQLLLSHPDLLILDEPTNHLDIQAVEWLESYLAQWEGAALIVSHDRYFMDKVANMILEMSRAGFEVYRGNYSAYIQQRQDRWEERQRIYVIEKERLEKEYDYIKRNIAGQNVAQAKGRLRRLSRHLQAIDQLGMQAVINKNWGEVSQQVQTTVSMMSVEEAWQHIRSLRPPTNRPLQLHIKLRAEERSGEIVLRANQLKVGYPGKTLFHVPDIELRRLECAALIGPNGAGKTTFLKTILGLLEPLDGELTLGASLSTGYFAQAHEGLDPERTLVEEIESVMPHWLVGEIREYLARFLFTGEDVFKKVAVISGGERGRLALAKLALSNANLLLLDEPTNHLDIPAQEILQEVLATFQGTTLLVSHDRYLIDALATQVWEIDEDHATLHIFKGTYSEYRTWQEAQKMAEKAALENQSQTATNSQKTRVINRSASIEKRRQAQLKELETQISELETQLASLSRMLENPPDDTLKVQRLGNDYVRLQTELDDLFLEWEKLHAEAEN